MITGGASGIGLGTNTWTMGLDQPVGEPRPDLYHQSRFQMPGVAHRLQDVYCVAARSDPTLGDDDRWWTYDTRKRRCRFDQLWASEHFDVRSAWSSPEVPPPQCHRMLGATLAL